MASPMVAAFIWTISSLFVSFLSGVGIRTFFAINFKIPINSAAQRFLLACHQCLKFPQTRLNLSRIAHMPIYGVHGLQAVASNTKHRRSIGWNLAGRNQFLGHSNRDPARGLSED